MTAGDLADHPIAVVNLVAGRTVYFDQPIIPTLIVLVPAMAACFAAVAGVPLDKPLLLIAPVLAAGLAFVLDYFFEEFEFRLDAPWRWRASTANLFPLLWMPGMGAPLFVMFIDGADWRSYVYGTSWTTARQTWKSCAL